MASVEKKKRSQALSNFTRNVNKLTELIDSLSPLVVVTPQFEKVMKCWEKLEEAQDEFIAITDIEDVDTDPEGVQYLDAPGIRHSECMKKYSEYLRSEEKVEERNRQQKESDERNFEVERSKREIQESVAKETAVRELELNTKHASVKAECRPVWYFSCECVIGISAVYA